MIHITKHQIILGLIFVLAFILRIYGLNWDQGFHLHPDERFLTMLATDISLPSSLKDYFDYSTSPLNPYNYNQYRFYVYGTFPVFLTKVIAVILNLNNYHHLVLVGRVLSALFDSLNIFIIYFIAKKLWPRSRFLVLAPLTYSLLILPVQLSHFFAVDTFLNFFLLFSFCLLLYQKIIPASMAFALALSCKVSAFYFLPILFLLWLWLFLKAKQKNSILFSTFSVFLVSILFFRLISPYTFSSSFRLSPDFLNSLNSLRYYSRPDSFYPPGIQWLNRSLFLYPLKNLLIWGLGLPFSAFFLILLIKSFKKLRFNFNPVLIIVIWVVALFVFQSTQFSHSMRYYLLIYPYLSLIFTLFFTRFYPNKKFLSWFLVLQFLSVCAFLSIYSRPHSRVQASRWILDNIPFDKKLSAESWDDALPLGSSPYQIISLPLFDQDTSQKWQQINADLNQIDYLVLSSNRLWASIPRVPDFYPISSQFYQDLFSGHKNFSLINRFHSYPGIPLPFLKQCIYFGPTNYPGQRTSWLDIDHNCSYPGIYFRDDTAEEAFTVYDHPQVLIFQKEK